MKKGYDSSMKSSVLENRRAPPSLLITKGLLSSVVDQEVVHHAPNTPNMIVPLHPLGVRPAGNAYTATKNLKNTAGFFAFLPDELIMSVLERLEAEALLNVRETCKALYAFSRFDELWKTLCIASPLSFESCQRLKWHGNWYYSFRGLPSSHGANIHCKELFSDTLHRPFLCAHTPLQPYTTNIPERNNINRMPNLSTTEFSELWTDKPFILTDPVKSWKLWRVWDQGSMRESYGDIKFRAEAVDWPFEAYLDYMDNTADESPLYLFDHLFVEKMNLTVGTNGDYCVPECFGQDLFASLGENRPDSRWLIIGPERSGSTFHKDPNATSAWNAVIRGSKYWIMFPTSRVYPPPPGVYVSEDQSEVTSPLSIAEWLLEFHAEARATAGCVEGICHAGEVLHVPSGWWHLVVNLSPSIAITQNFVPQAHLPEVLAFLKDKPDQVSGFKKKIADPYGLFLQKMKEQHPEILQTAIQQLERAKEGRKRKWDELVKGHDEHEALDDDSNGFSFGFGGADEDDVP